VDFDDSLGRVIAALLLVLLLVPLLVIVAFVVGEVLLLLLLLPFFMLARSVFGTPWVIEVTRKRTVVHVEAVEGWAASSQRMECLATALRQGDPSRGGLRLATDKDALADIPTPEHDGGQADHQHDQNAQVGRAVTKGQ
jgi:hypothetical protein